MTVTNVATEKQKGTSLNLDKSVTSVRKLGKFIPSTDRYVIPLILITIILLFIWGGAYLHSIRGRYIFTVRVIGECPFKARDHDKFVSVALDSANFADNFRQINLTNERLIALTRLLAPAYLRIGGNLADRLYFISNSTKSDVKDISDLSLAHNYTFNGKDWLALNAFAQKSGLEIIFDLNALQRLPDGSWDPHNALELIRFTNKNKLTVHWELGNEPNNFQHKFNYTVLPEQLAQDFRKLSRVLRPHKKKALTQQSLIIGPDVTRPILSDNNFDLDSLNYLRTFSEYVDCNILNAVSWHQYYMDGRTATIEDFLDLDVFNQLSQQICAINYIMHTSRLRRLPVWLGETSSAYGGGAPGLSDRFVATFLWIDKLGLASKSHIAVVIRQSLFRGHYALIDNNYDPNPDWWVSVLYKRLIGNVVMHCDIELTSNVRLYCSRDAYRVTIFAINLNQKSVPIVFDIPNKYVNAYILTTDDLFSKNVFLNGKLLKVCSDNILPPLEPEPIPVYPYVKFPGYSIGFWTFPYQNDSFYE